MSQGPWGKSREAPVTLPRVRVTLRGDFRLAFAALLASSRTLFEEEGEPLPPPARHRARLFERLGRGEDAVLFGTVDAPLGHAQWARSRDGLLLRELRFAPALRRQGQGHGFLTWLQSTAPEQRITVHVLESNPAALAFWQAQAARLPQLCLEILALRRPLG